MSRPISTLALLCALQALAIPRAPHAGPHDPVGALAWLFGMATILATPVLLWHIWRHEAAAPTGTGGGRTYGLLALSVILVFLDAGFVIGLAAR